MSMYEAVTFWLGKAVAEATIALGVLGLFFAAAGVLTVLDWVATFSRRKRGAK
jgi:hypothetical protein